MAKKDQRPPDDKLEPQRNGTIHATVAGVKLRLRRPTIGEQRDFVERLEEIADRQQVFQREVEDRSAAAAAGDSGDGTAALRELRREHEQRIEADLLAWWRLVFTTLDDSGGDGLPDSDEDLPPWLLSAGLTSEIRRVWLTVPWGPGGSPTQQEATRAADTLRSALASVTPTN